MIARTGSRSARHNWKQEEHWWRQNFQNRPYVQNDRGFDFYRPGYRYGFESATHFIGRDWDEVEPELRRNWEQWEHRGESRWDEIKDSVKDAWHHATGSRSRGRSD